MIERGFDRLHSGDVEGFLACFTPDGVIVSMLLGMQFRGRGGIREWWQLQD